MWIVDDDGDMFNTDHYKRIGFHQDSYIRLWYDDNNCDKFCLASHLCDEERLTRYYDLVEKLTGERIDG